MAGGHVHALYRHGDFVDLCRGPHLQRTGQIGAVRLLESSGAYFKGDERNEMLQRIYGTAFATRKELEAYFERLEEIRRRDHRRLGRDGQGVGHHARSGTADLPLWHGLRHGAQP